MANEEFNSFLSNLLDRRTQRRQIEFYSAIYSKLPPEQQTIYQQTILERHAKDTLQEIDEVTQIMDKQQLQDLRKQVAKTTIQIQTQARLYQLHVHNSLGSKTNEFRKPRQSRKGAFY